MIVKLWDKSEIIISKEKGAKLQEELLKPDNVRLAYVRINGELVATSAIAMVKNGGIAKEDLVNEGHRIAAPEKPEITDEQRAKNLEKIAQMKKDYLERKSNSESTGDVEKTERKWR